jgi:hypothetical protein
MTTPLIEILYTEGCGNAGPTGALVQEVAKSLAPGAGVRRILVRDLEHAKELQFPGSPTVRVGGVDIEGDVAGDVGFS